MEDNRWYWWEDENTLVFNVLGTPSSKKTQFLKPYGNQLKISVAAAAEKGKATKHLIKFLAKEFGVRQNDVELIFGLTTTSKQFRIHNPKKLPEVFKQ